MESEESELVEIYNLKELKTSQSRHKHSNKKRHQRGEYPRNRCWSPEWIIPAGPKNQIKREEAKAEALPKFWDWPVTKMQPVKKKLRSHLNSHWMN